MDLKTFVPIVTPGNLQWQISKHPGPVSFLVFIFLFLSSCQTQKTTSASLSQGQPPEPAQRNFNPYPSIPIEDFVHVWKGDGTCIPVNGVTITEKDSNSIYLSGFQGEKLTGIVRGYIVDILSSPSSKNNVVGRMVLSNDRRSLRAYLVLNNGGKTDSCNTVMHY
ncbi:MAG: hypothetical protein JWO06_4077 [Bacteroidota bacterium]|nr:hypothetical protein [Bacteroidota bacterium]